MPLSPLTSDGFSGTDHTNLHGRALDNAGGGSASHTWTVPAGRGGAYEILSGQAHCTANGPIGDSIVVVDSMAAVDHQRASFTTVTGNSGVIVRYDGASGAFYLWFFGFATGGGLLYRATGAGSFTQLGSGGISNTGASVIRLEANGTTLTASVDGVTDITTSDGTIATGKPGMYGGASPATSMEDFLVEGDGTIASGVGVSVGGSTAFAVGMTIITGTGVSVSPSTAQAAATAIATGVGTALSPSVAIAAGSSIAAGVGSSQSANSAIGAGASIALGSGRSLSLSFASGSASSQTPAALGFSFGGSRAFGVGSAIARGDGAALSMSCAAAAGASIAAGNGSAPSTSVGFGAPAAIAAGVGITKSVSHAVAAGGAIAAAIAFARSLSTAFAVIFDPSIVVPNRSRTFATVTDTHTYVTVNDSATYVMITSDL